MSHGGRKVNPADFKEDVRMVKLVARLNEIGTGHLDVTGTVTLTANAATTTVTDSLFNAGEVPLFTAATANAAAEIKNGTMYVSSRTNGSFVITHANNAQTDRTFLYVRLG